MQEAITRLFIIRSKEFHFQTMILVEIGSEQMVTRVSCDLSREPKFSGGFIERSDRICEDEGAREGEGSDSSVSHGHGGAEEAGQKDTRSGPRVLQNNVACFGFYVPRFLGIGNHW